MHNTTINVTIKINIQPSVITPAKTSEQLAEDYRAAVIAEATEKGSL